MFEDLKCPYCNADYTPTDKIGDAKPVAMTTTCCNRVVMAQIFTEPLILVVPASAEIMREQGIQGNVSPVAGMKIQDDSRPHSRWTFVATDGLGYYVRIIPNFFDIESLGRPWGLALMQRFNSHFEAHKFADSVDEFFEAMVAALLPPGQS